MKIETKIEVKLVWKVEKTDKNCETYTLYCNDALMSRLRLFTETLPTDTSIADEPVELPYGYISSSKDFYIDDDPDGIYHEREIVEKNVFNLIKKMFPGVTVTIDDSVFDAFYEDDEIVEPRVEAKIRPIRLELEAKIEKQLAQDGWDTSKGTPLGFCNIYWGVKQDILKRDYGIRWKTPRALNPDTEYD